MALLEERKKKLAAEGLFDDARKKRKLPFLPRVIGVVTSPTGAVIRDMLHGFNERFPARVLRVAGAGAGRDLRGRGGRRHPRLQRAARRAAAIPRPDVLIVARGGGSLEDLWGFNEEIVVRAAAAEHDPADLRRRPRDRLDADRPRRRRARADAHQGRRMGGAEVLRAGRADRQVRPAAEHCRAPGARRHARPSAGGGARPAAAGSDLLALPRQRFDAVDRRLDRALLANTQRARARAWRVVPRACSRGCWKRALARARDRLEALGARANGGAHAHHRTAARAAGATCGPAAPQSIGDALGCAESASGCDVLARGCGNCLKRCVARPARVWTAAPQLLASLELPGRAAAGFALVRDERRAARALGGPGHRGQRLDIELADGHVAPRPWD